MQHYSENIYLKFTFFFTVENDSGIFRKKLETYKKYWYQSIPLDKTITSMFFFI